MIPASQPDWKLDDMIKENTPVMKQPAKVNTSRNVAKEYFDCILHITREVF